MNCFRACTWVAVIVQMACSHSTTQPIQVPKTDNREDYCDMAAAALRATVKTFKEQPLGLERACVEARALTNRQIYVDASFSQGSHVEADAEPNCVRDNYVIRFTSTNSDPWPPSEVILLIVAGDGSHDRTFNARMEAADWPTRKPGVVGLSQCGSAYGVLHRSADAWVATIQPPPRSADAL
jgi:hypothetical protein